ncbi:RAMP superfamily CRISPR-associated protein [Hydrocoleum sp. CS-953]|uniref:RAMP superfamily CRISPR-associated protein n=1 Tax=Microcoleaceae TaxID=1892252 RepID=UPI000B9A4E25|nr:RAMP superfamily CRISPR-associated protein [Hydrocoleum sp. CS-953]OZH51981.1 CRISPR-associated protein [Hydrocoleum sp. CS-953]
MHKRFVNHCTIDINLIPDRPILIKSGREGADPTKPQMEFVQTYYNGEPSIYLPGSSLKGAIRAHAERIVRTVGREKRDEKNPDILWASNPVNQGEYDYLKDLPPHEIYHKSSFTDQMFGNTSIASRIRIEDAYPIDIKQLKTEERNGVAIDRVFGSVAVGPFNFQVCTSGEFKTKIHLKNFTLAQLGLIGLVLRDLNEGWFGIGFAKSRGLGTVKVKYNSAVVKYPSCQVEEKQIFTFGKDKKSWFHPHNFLLGAGEFLSEDEAKNYGFPKPDKIETPVVAQPMELGFGVELTWDGDEQVQDLFRRAVKVWSILLGGKAA